MMKKILKNNYKSVIALLLSGFVWTIIIYLRNVCFGEYTFMHSDMQSQIMPMLTMFIKQLLSSRSLLYTFSYGLGGSTIPVYTNGACFSFFNLLLLLPVGIDFKAFLLVIAKLSFSAFCFNEMCRIIFKKNDVISICTSVAYSLCSFNLAYYFVVIWQDGMYMLPIILILLYRLINSNKGSLLIMAYAYLFICNFYSGYIIGIYTFISFILVVFFLDVNKTAKITFLIKYVTYVLIAVLISAVVLLPTAVAIINNDASEATVFSNISLNIFDFIRQLFLGQYVMDGENGTVPYIYVGILPFAGAIAFYYNKKIDKSKKIIYACLICFLIFCSLTKYGYMFAHAFNNPDNFGYRFGFLVSFTCLMMFMHSIDKFDAYTKKSIIVTAFSLIVYIIMQYIVLDKFSKIDYIGNVVILLINIVVIIAYMLAICYLEKKKVLLIAMISVLFLLEIVFNGVCLGNMIDRTVAENKKVFGFYYEEEKKAVEELGDVYTRISMPNSVTYNMSQLLGFRSVNAFSSFLSYDIRVVMRRLGYAASDLEIKDIGGTCISRMILGVDYTLNMNDYSIGDNEVGIYENKALPIAYMSSPDVVDVSMSDNPFENMNKLLSGLTGKKVDYYYNTGANVTINTNNIILGTDVYNGEEVALYSLEDDKQSGFIEFVDEKKESKYCYFTMQDSYTYYNSPIISGDNEGYRDKFDLSYISIPHIVEMGTYEDANKSYIILDEKTTDSYYFSQAMFYGENSGLFDEIYNDINANSMDISVFEDGYIEGTVISPDDRNILFTTIPYDDNWNVLIDGVKTNKIKLLDNAFLGVVVPAGKHKIELKYIDHWLINGGIVSGIGIVLLIMITICENKKCKTSINKKEL